MNAQTNAKSRTRTRKAATPQPPTIYDGEKYFDAKFTDDELFKLDERILAECGFANDQAGFRWLSMQWINLGCELGRKLGTGMVSREWVTIHMCRELEIDYKSFAKNVPKLPIEPFYRFIESRFPHFKQTSNKMRLEVQEHHMHLAFIDWVDAECERIGCSKSYHGLGCGERYEKPDYSTAVQRVWKHNAARPKLTLAYSREWSNASQGLTP